MVPHEFVVWEWLDSHGDPFYVDFGKMPLGCKHHPAKTLYNARNRIDSDLTEFLRAFGKEPQRSKDLPISKMHRREAKGIVYARRMQLKKQGFELLSNRPYGTCIGGGTARKVVSPEGEVYPSVRAAAAKLGVNQCTITRRCNNQQSGWKYADA